jgi:acyl-CoA hydrolase
MPDKKTVSAQAAARMTEGEGRIFLAGCASEPRAILDAVSGEPDLWRNETLAGTFVPGINDRDFSAIGLGTTVESIFATRGLTPGATRGRLDLLPLHYSAQWRYLATPGRVKVAYVEIPPPRNDGMVGLGVSADFVLAPVAAGARLVGVINARMPDMANGPALPVDRFAAFVEDDHDLPVYDAGEIDPATAAIGARIAELLAPGDTLQLGLGKVQSAVLEALRKAGLGGLAFHAGMISTPMLDALKANVFSRGVTTGVALGHGRFYEEVAARKDIRFAPVGYTHAQTTFSSIERFISVNSVLEVDLHGQANGEFLGGRQISGHGGMVDFIRGAREARSGLSILALPATGRNGTVSRIVPRLAAGAPVTVARSDVDLVITEFGTADLRFASTTERARRLTAIADPAFRDELEGEWRRAT